MYRCRTVDRGARAYNGKTNGKNEEFEIQLQVWLHNKHALF